MMEILLIFFTNGIDNQVPILSITDTKLFVLVTTLSTQENLEPLGQLKSDFKRTIILSKYQSKVSMQHENNIYIIYLIQVFKE